MKNFLRSTMCAIVLFTIGCTTTPTKQLPQGTWAESAFVMEHITEAMLAANPGPICPRYAAIDRLHFWDVFIKAIVSAESSFNPESYMTENQGIDRVTGSLTKSEGYLHLSYKDTIHQYYKDLPAVQEISWPKRNIRDPHINLAAGLAIMDERIRRTGVDVTNALGPYWSTVAKWPQKLGANLKAWIPECY